MTCDDSGIRRLILASGSPRRRQLLSLLGIPFVVKTSNVVEQLLDGEAPSDLVLRVSRAKACAVKNTRSDELVVAADTIVVLGDDILGKPASPQEATEMLQHLRDRPHTVYTGVTVWYRPYQRLVRRLVESTVWMRDYADEEVAGYVASGDPLDKAGAYAIQHTGFSPASSVDGCWLNVMGLPLCHLGEALAQFGVVVPPNVPGTCRAFTQRGCQAVVG